MARANPEPPRPIIIKKITIAGHGGHHGGAWKVAYADFVTAMMAFFLLMWLLGATTEKQRRGIADYFTPTLVEMRQNSAGSNGMFGGDSLMSRDNYPTRAGQTGTRSITIPRDTTGTADDAGREAQSQAAVRERERAREQADLRSRDRQRFRETRRQIEQRLDRTAALRRLRRNLRFTETREGLRIDLVDEADFAMFALATDQLLPDARALVGEIASVVAATPNGVIVRGHTDALPYASGRTMSNWRLSAARADATRQALAATGVTDARFERIEGVADREPFNPRDRNDPRNRRMSITLAWSRAAGQ